MKLISLSFIIWLTSFIGFSQLKIDSSRNEDLLKWKKERRLTWDDFKGQSSDTVYLPDTEFKASAISCIHIKYKYHTKAEYLDFLIENVFLKKCSFVNDQQSDPQSDQLLLHEQGHFDLAEIYARRMRKEIEKLQEKKVKSLVKYAQVYDSLYSELDSINIVYDEETFFGAIKKAQLEWENRIDNELEALDKFKSN